MKYDYRNDYRIKIISVLSKIVVLTEIEFTTHIYTGTRIYISMYEKILFHIFDLF